MAARWEPFHEPVRQTLFRTVTIALVIGGTIAVLTRNRLSWPLATLSALWPSFGGHWLELWFLNWLRPRVSSSPGVQAATRGLVWFAGGSLLALAMRVTASAFAPSRSTQWLAWWVGGAAFVGIELVVHLFLQIRGRPSFYNGRG